MSHLAKKGPSKSRIKDLPAGQWEQDSRLRWGVIQSALGKALTTDNETHRILGLPAAFVDLDTFHANCRRVAALAGPLPVRLATKSLRCTDLMQLVLDEHPTFRGLMAWSPAEAAWLASKGFDDILIAYPSLDHHALRKALDHVQRGRRIVFMIDDVAHVDLLSQLAGDQSFEICIDLDMSVTLPGLHFGVRRSPLKTPAQILDLAKKAARDSRVRLTGVMGYEAQVAGIQDTSRTSPALDRITRLLKILTTPRALKRRQNAVSTLKAEGFDVTLVNGGGSGSLATSRQDPSLTELTAGSALYCPHLFDGYHDLACSPAAGFALQIIRSPAKGIWTCSGGGLAASGSAGPDRLPLPWFPAHARLLPHEGAGEVQTPILIPSEAGVRLGDLVLFRHAKAGELCEHFNELALISGSEVTRRTRTYRGEGQKF